MSYEAIREKRITASAKYLRWQMVAGNVAGTMSRSIWLKRADWEKE